MEFIDKTMKEKRRQRASPVRRLVRRSASEVGSFSEGGSIEYRAFTLIELMIVVVILGLLATIIVPRILHRPEQARRMKAKVDISNIETALALFKTD
jgi:prepilin-type N-terminal cleavage/methylation domain-containing protein